MIKVKSLSPVAIGFKSKCLFFCPFPRLCFALREVPSAFFFRFRVRSACADDKGLLQRQSNDKTCPLFFLRHLPSRVFSANVRGIPSLFSK